MVGRTDPSIEFSNGSIARSALPPPTASIASGIESQGRDSNPSPPKPEFLTASSLKVPGGPRKATLICLPSLSRSDSLRARPLLEGDRVGRLVVVEERLPVDRIDRDGQGDLAARGRVERDGRDSGLADAQGGDRPLAG